MYDDYSSDDSSDYETYRVNPTTGLIIPDGSDVDVGGNPYGAFDSSDSSSKEFVEGNNSTVGYLFVLFIIITNISIIYKMFF